MKMLYKTPWTYSINMFSIIRKAYTNKQVYRNYKKTYVINFHIIETYTFFLHFGKKKASSDPDLDAIYEKKLEPNQTLKYPT